MGNVMFVAYAAVSLVIVTVIISLYDQRVQKSRRGRNGQRYDTHNYPHRNIWELTQLDCDFGSAWPHSSGPARALYLPSDSKHDSE